MIRKIIASVVLVGIAATAYFVPPFDLSPSTQNLPSISGMTLMVIPLDDRPVNTYVPDKLAKSNGIELLLPPSTLLGNFEKPGHSNDILTWAKQNAPSVDGFIVSTDMLTYGGLVASRTNAITEGKALSRLGFLEDLHSDYPDKPIYAYSSLLRLAPTASDEASMEMYRNVREWAILKGKSVSKKSDKWDEELAALEKKIDPALLADYIALRERNVAVNQKLVSYAAGGILESLVFGQDDSAPQGLHRVEQERLVSLIEQKGVSRATTLPGIDELGTMMVSRATLDAMDYHPSVYVVYDNPFARWWTPPMEDSRLKDNVNRHIESIGAKKTRNPLKADMYYFVKTPFTPSVLSLAFSKKLEGYMDAGRTVFVADVAKVNQAHPAFTEQLLNNFDPNRLVAYSAWNTAGNSIGLSLAFATMREATLASSGSLSTDQNMRHTEHHLELLTRSFLVDYGYKTLSYPLMREAAKQNNADELRIEGSTLPYEKIAETELNILGNQLVSNRLEERRIFIDRKDQESISVNGLSYIRAVMPWNRFFEIETTPDLWVELDK